MCLGSLSCSNNWSVQVPTIWYNLSIHLEGKYLESSWLFQEPARIIKWMLLKCQCNGLERRSKSIMDLGFQPRHQGKINTFNLDWSFPLPVWKSIPTKEMFYCQTRQGLSYVATITGSLFGAIKVRPPPNSSTSIKIVSYIVGIWVTIPSTHQTAEYWSSVKTLTKILVHVWGKN